MPRTEMLLSLSAKPARPQRIAHQTAPRADRRPSARPLHRAIRAAWARTYRQKALRPRQGSVRSAAPFAVLLKRPAQARRLAHGSHSNRLCAGRRACDQHPYHVDAHPSARRAALQPLQTMAHPHLPPRLRGLQEREALWGNALQGVYQQLAANAPEHPHD